MNGLSFTFENVTKILFPMFLFVMWMLEITSVDNTRLFIHKSLITTGVVIKEWLGVSIYTDNLLSQKKLSYLSTEKLWIKLGVQATFNVSVHQVL